MNQKCKTRLTHFRRNILRNKCFDMRGMIIPLIWTKFTRRHFLGVSIGALGGTSLLWQGCWKVLKSTARVSPHGPIIRKYAITNFLFLVQNWCQIGAELLARPRLKLYNIFILIPILCCIPCSLWKSSANSIKRYLFLIPRKNLPFTLDFCISQLILHDWFILELISNKY